MSSAAREPSTSLLTGQLLKDRGELQTNVDRFPSSFALRSADENEQVAAKRHVALDYSPRSTAAMTCSGESFSAGDSLKTLSPKPWYFHHCQRDPSVVDLSTLKGDSLTVQRHVPDQCVLLPELPLYSYLITLLMSMVNMLPNNSARSICLTL